MSLYYNPVTLADADKLTPNFSWTAFFESQPLTRPETFSLAMPAFHQEVNTMLERRAGGRVADLPALPPVDGASPYLSDAFVAEQLQFLQQDAAAARRK